MSAYPKHWISRPIHDLCTSIVDCVNKTAPTAEGTTPFKMIRTTNVRNGWVDLEQVKYVSEETYRKWTRRQVPKRGDIILTREAPLGEVGMLRTDDSVFLGQRTVAYRIDERIAEPNFVLFAMQSHDVQGQIKAFGSGSTVEHMRVPDCGKFKITLPPLETQQRIAAVLSAYDDLIENNTRRIQILEEMARRLYEEWFVHFRFPGHDSVPMNGDLPNGWERGQLSNYVSINPRTKVPRDGEKPFVPMGSLSERQMLIGPVERRSGNSGTKFVNGDTLVARITPCLENGKTGFVDFLTVDDPVAFGSTEFIVLRPGRLGACATYCLARSHEFRDTAIKSMSGSEGRQRVRPESVSNFELPLPPEELLQEFEARVAPSFAQVRALGRTNTNLRAQRDLLLPKLVSGQIDIAAAEKALEDAA